MNKFKKYEHVVCIENMFFSYSLCIGKVYVVVKILLPDFMIVEDINKTIVTVSVPIEYFMSQKDFNIKQRKEKLIKINLL